MPIGKSIEIYDEVIITIHTLGLIGRFDNDCGHNIGMQLLCCAICKA